jgi:hypothetical protein
MCSSSSNLINLSAIHSEHYTKIDELFAVLRRSSGSGRSPYDDTLARIQLPTIPLPRFNGDIGEWVYFRDKFTFPWSALKERFEVKRVIADAQILKLFNLKPMSRDLASELRHMIYVVIKSLRVLGTIDLKLDSRSEMLLK